MISLLKGLMILCHFVAFGTYSHNWAVHGYEVSAPPISEFSGSGFAVDIFIFSLSENEYSQIPFFDVNHLGFRKVQLPCFGPTSGASPERLGCLSSRDIIMVYKKGIFYPWVKQFNSIDSSKACLLYTSPSPRD